MLKRNGKIPFIGYTSIAVLVGISLVTSLLALVVPFSVLILFDRVVPNSAINSLWSLYGIIIFALVLDTLVKKREVRILTRISKNFEQTLSHRLFQSFSQKTLLEFSRLSTGEYIERIDTIKKIKEFYGGGWTKSIINMLSAVIILFVIFLINSGSGITLVAASVILLSISLYLSKRENHARDTMSDTEGKTQSRIIELVKNPISIKGASMEFRMENAMKTAIENRENDASQYEQYQSNAPLLQSLVQQGSIAIILVYCGLAVMAETTSQGSMAAIILLTNRFFAPLNQMVSSIGQFRANFAILNRIYDVIDDISERQDDSHGVDISQIILSDLNLTFCRNIVNIVQGPSGIGKTHLSRMVSGESQWNGLHGHLLDTKGKQYDLTQTEHTTLRVDMTTGFVEGTIIDNVTCFQPELYKAALSLSESLRIKEHIDGLRNGFYSDIHNSKMQSLPRQVIFSLMIIRAILCDMKIIIIDDIDLVYDADFAARLVNCFSSRLSSTVIIIISNKISLSDHRLRYHTLTASEALAHG